MRFLKFLLSFILVLSFTGFVLAGGAGEEAAQSSDETKIRIVATTSIVGDVVSSVASDTVELKILMPRGQNPHSYQPSPRDIGALERANLVFVNGLGLEEELLSILEGMDVPDPVSLSNGIHTLEDGHSHDDHSHDGEPEEGHHHDDAMEEGNPHVWFAPRNVMVWVENIREALIQADPANESSYNRNAQNYLDRLGSLDAEIRDAVSVIPENKRKLVMDHDSMAYFAEDYGFDVVGLILPSFSDQSEPSSRDIAKLAEQVKNDDIRVIFLGETAGTGLRKLVTAIAAETGINLQAVELLSGSLSPEGERGDSYIDFMRYNTELIVGALTQ